MHLVSSSEVYLDQPLHQFLTDRDLRLLSCEQVTELLVIHFDETHADAEAFQRLLPELVEEVDDHARKQPHVLVQLRKIAEELRLRRIAQRIRLTAAGLPVS